MAPFTLLSINAFAAQVARNDACIKTACIPFQKCFRDADDAGKKQLLGDWKNGYVREVFSLGEDFTASKGKAMQELTKAKHIDWAEYVAAIDRANSHFGYYVSCTIGAKDTTSDDIGVPKHIQELADALAKACAAYGAGRKLCSTALAKSFAK